MDFKDLDKKQLILLTLLITFVVSIATGVISVSLMNQMPKSVPQTINNVIERTIEKVTKVQVPATVLTENNNSTNSNNTTSLFNNSSDALISIYPKNGSGDVSTIPTDQNTPTNENGVDQTIIDPTLPVAIGQGVIVSDIGLILVDSSLLTDGVSYKVILNKKDFDVSVLKKFGNGFTILKISPIVESPVINTENQVNP